MVENVKVGVIISLPSLNLREAKDIKFADLIKKKTIDLVKQKGFNEYFSCKTGKGFGATNFSWTASLFLDLILENKYE